MKKLSIIVLILSLLGGLFWALRFTDLSYENRVAVSEMTPGADGVFSVAFSPPWYLEVNPRHFSNIAVTLTGAASLERFSTRIALLQSQSQQGFYVGRREIFIQLSSSQASSSEAAVSISIPAKPHSLIHSILFLLAIGLGLWLWLKEGLRALVRKETQTLRWTSLGALAATLVGLWLLLATKGITIWIGLGMLICGILGVLASILSAEIAPNGKSPRLRNLTVNALLAAASTFLCFAAIEAYLSMAAERFDEESETKPALSAEMSEEWFQLPEEVVARAVRRGQAMTLPAAWRRQPVEVANANFAYNWHDALHLHDDRGFRRLNAPFPSKQPDTLRIMVIGDSMTYGYGVADDWTFSRLLEKALRTDYRAEVINLGRGGYQSSDILDVAKTFAPQIEPDLIIYAVCLNDFLPSGQNENTAPPFPLPGSWKSYLKQRTLLYELFSDSFRTLLLATGLRKDFFDDIIWQIDGNAERFAEDVRATNRVAEDDGLPPVIGIVFHNNFAGDNRAWPLIETAEASLAAGGFDLISIKPWKEKMAGKSFPVSRWEGHPNELAHSLVAEALYERLLERGDAKGYERRRQAAVQTQERIAE